MLQKIKKGLSVALLGAKALVLVLILIYIGLLSDDVRIMSTMGATDVSYVLVNEDLGAVFNGVEYNLGTEFIGLITQDTQNRWQTATRSVAEAGFRSGAFDVMIILPQDFSTRLLALQSFTPEQAEIVYEVRHGQNELVNMSINAQVTDVLNDFNERIVRMYFASMLNSLFDAQLEFGALVDGESNRHDFFMDHVQHLFLRLPSEFSSVVVQSEVLQDRTEGWRLGHEHFVEITQGALLTTMEIMSANTETLADYIDLMYQIGQVNVSNTQFAMQRQHEADGMHFSGFNNTVLEHMTEFSDRVVHNFEQRGRNFSADQERLQVSLGAQLAALRDEVDELEDLRDLVADIFFDGSTPPLGADDESIETAIISLIADRCEYDLCLHPAYIQTIEDYLGDILNENIDQMISDLYGMGFISGSQRDEYNDQLKIIRRFADENYLPFAPPVDFSWEQGNAAQIYSALFRSGKSFDLNPNQNMNTIRFLGPDHISIYNILEVQASLISQISAHHYYPDYLNFSVDLVTDSEGREGIDIEFRHVMCPGSSPNYEDEPCFPGVFTDIEIELQFVYFEWEFRNNERVRMFYQHDLNWRVNGQNTPFILSHFFPSHALGSNLSLFLEQIRLIERSSRQIITLFGDPEVQDDTDDETAAARFLRFLEEEGCQTEECEEDLEECEEGSEECEEDSGECGECPTVCRPTLPNRTTIKGLAPENSIYRRYGSYTNERREILIVEALREAFYGIGIDLHADLENARHCLHYIINGSGGETMSIEDRRACLFNAGDVIPENAEFFLSLSGIHRIMLPLENTLLAQVIYLRNWHSDSLEGIEEQYNTWTHGRIIELLLRENFGSSFSETHIYYNTQTGKNMIQLTNLLVASSQNEISNIISGTADLETLDDEFNSMTTNTNNVSGQMETLLGNIDVLDGELYTNVNANLAYAQNFGTIMENARIGGGHNPTFLNFLPRPLASVGAQVVTGEVSIIPYYLTIISTILNFSASYGLKHFWKKREHTAVDQLVNRGLIWKNTPFTLKLIAVSLALGFAFSAVSVRAIESVQPMTWLMFVPLLITFGILIVTYLARQFPKASLFVVGAVIAVYLLLNPVLGTQIEPGTFMAWLFRASPLQHVENIFARLYTGGFFSMINYIIMIVLLGVGVLLNLLVTEKNIEVAGDVTDEK